MTFLRMGKTGLIDSQTYRHNGLPISLSSQTFLARSLTIMKKYPSG